MGIPVPGGFADVDDSFEVLPAGVYDVVVFKGEVKEAGSLAKNPGSQYISWELNVLNEGFEKRKVWMNSSLVDRALPMLKRFLKAVGFTEEELNASDFEINIDDIVGRPCRAVVTVGVNPKTDEPNNSVKKVLPPGAIDTELP